MFMILHFILERMATRSMETSGVLFFIRVVVCVLVDKVSNALLSVIVMSFLFRAIVASSKKSIN